MYAFGSKPFANFLRFTSVFWLIAFRARCDDTNYGKIHVPVARLRQRCFFDKQWETLEGFRVMP